MSYLFDGGFDDRLNATLTTGLSMPVTIAAWVKITTWNTFDSIINLGVNSGSTSDSVELRSRSTTNSWQAAVSGSSQEVSEIIDDITADGWVPMIAVFTSSTSRQLFVDGIAATESTNSSTITGSMTFLRVGANLNSGDHFTGRIARVAIWDKALDGTERGQWDAGTVPTTNLRAYWSLESDATKTDGADSVGSLSVNGPTLDSSDNPTFATASAGRMLLLGAG